MPGSDDDEKVREEAVQDDEDEEEEDNQHDEEEDNQHDEEEEEEEDNQHEEEEEIEKFTCTGCEEKINKNPHSTCKLCRNMWCVICCHNYGYGSGLYADGYCQSCQEKISKSEEDEYPRIKPIRKIEKCRPGQCDLHLVCSICDHVNGT